MESKFKVAVVLSLFCGVCSAEEPTYTVIAPNVIRPNIDFLVAVTTHNVVKDQDFYLTISGRSDSGRNIEIRQDTTVQPDQTQIVRLRIGDLGPGSYTLHARGTDPISFEKTSELTYIHQGYTVFIQTDKAIYRPGNVVKFRSIVVSPQLKPSVVGAIDVNVKDGGGHLIKRWDRVFTTDGVFSGEFRIADKPVRGEWNITVDVSGQIFHKTFQVAEYILPKFIVEIDFPHVYGLFNEGDTKVTIRASYPHHGGPVKGEATVSAYPLYKSGNLQPFFSKPARRVVPISGQVDVTFNLAKELRLTDDYSRDIVFDVKVKEDLTERIQNNTAIYYLHKYDYKLEMVRTADAYKPGMPYKAYLKLAKQDDIPIQDDLNPVIIKWGFSNRPEIDYNTTTVFPDKNGIIELHIDTPLPSSTEADVLGLEARYKNLTQWFSTIPRAQSRSGLYLQSVLRTNNPRVGRDIRIGITSSESLDSLTYLVFGRGKLVFSETAKINSNSKYNEVSFPAMSDMSPICRVIVYYVSRFGEIIADSLDFKVSGTLTNFVDISASKKQSLPSKDVTINVKAKPKSFVGLLAVDKSVRSLKVGHDILLPDIVKELRQYDTASTPSFFPWFKVIEPNEGSLSWYTGSTSAEDTFDKSGIIILTNGIIEKGQTQEKSATEYSGENRPFGRPLPGPGVSTLNPDKGPGLEYESATRPPLAGPYAFSRIPAPVDNFPKIYLKNDLPATWLFLNVTTDSEGRASIPVKSPIFTNTTWIISGFSLNGLNGMGITEQFGSLEVFQPFYVQVDLPVSVKRGEFVAVEMIVYNYLNREITADVTLENQGGNGFVFGTPDPNAIEEEEVGNDEEVNQNLFRQKRVSIRPGRGTLVTFIITPIRIGEVEMKITAKSSVGQDIQIGKLMVEAEGEVMYRNEAFFLDLRKESTVEKNITLEIPRNAVSGSERIYVSGISDPLGTAMNNLPSLIRYAVNCGEQNMIRMIPPVTIAEYLDESGSSSVYLKSTAVTLMEEGYQQQLAYLLDDGSFSTFGKEIDKVGSVWITSLVVSNFRRASKYIDVDDAVLTKALYWLSSQQASDGSFSEVGKVYFHDLQDDKMSMTAFVILSLLENKEKLDVNLKNVMNRGISYLSEHWQEIGDADENPFVLSIVGYALSRASHPQAEQVLVLLSDVLKLNETMSWLETEISNTTKDNPWNRWPNSINIQMTAYYALSLLQDESRIEEVLPVMNWLLSQQNSNGGFASTADTFVAIEALKQFSILLNVPESGSRVTVQYSYLEIVNNMEVDSSSSTILQKRILPPETRNLRLRATGSGFAVFQVGYEYNLDVVAAWPTFVLDPQVLKYSTDSHMQMTSCIQYIYRGDSNSSNMAVMELDMPSGYTVNTDALPSLRKIEGVTRVEVDNKNTKVILYYASIDDKEVCPTISGFRTHRVANQKPALVRAYDYFDQSRIARSFYNVVPATLCDICYGEDCPDDGCPDKPDLPTFGSYAYGSNVDSSGVGILCDSVSLLVILLVAVVLL